MTKITRRVEGDADSSVKCIQDCTPLKARWLIPLVLGLIEEKPKMTNVDIRNVLLAKYVKKARFLTSAILQNTRTMARDKNFEEPACNVFFANALFAKLKECAHDVEVVIKERLEVLRMLEHVILSDLLRKNKAEGNSMKKPRKLHLFKSGK